jgi:O-antigen ligase
MTPYAANYRWQKKAKVASLVALLALICVFLGVAISVLPLQLSAVLAVLAAAPMFAVFLWKMPAIEKDSGDFLRNVILASIFLYFIWPRNAFIPISALPIKHPQKLLYFAGIFLLIYYFAKSSLVRQAFAQNSRNNKSAYALLGMALIWGLVTVFTSVDSTYSFVAWVQLNTSVWLLVPILVLVLKTERDVHMAVRLLLFAGILNVAYAIPEVVTKKNIFDPFITLDLVDPAMAKQILAAVLRNGAYRAKASFDHPILFAEYLSLMIPFALYGLTQERLRRIAIIAMPALALGLVFTHSRIAFVAPVVSVAAFVVLILVRNTTTSGASAWPLVGTLLAVPVVATVAFLGVQNVSDLAAGRSAAEASSSNSRQQMLSAGIDLLQDSPVVGFGPGLGAMRLNFRNGEGVATLDNFLLLQALDSGVVSLLIFLAISGFVVWRAARHSFGSRNPYFFMAILSAMLGFLAIKMVLGTGLNNQLLAIMMVFVMLPQLYTEDKIRKS